ncbi:MAG: magnesium transporter CorA family protein [Endomicrobium sp.]|jgi:magnesium transporter|nr:magnesium transporter CorA family protein [Endomicrobium sp.]
MIKAIYTINNNYKYEYDVNKIIELSNKNFEMIWLDVHIENSELKNKEILLLHKYFRFHELSIEDCIFKKKYPKIEEFKNYIFSTTHGVQLKSDCFSEFRNSIYELNIFIGNNFVVTVHEEELFFLESIFEKAKIKPLIEIKSLKNLIYKIFNEVVASYDYALNKIDSTLNNIENGILKKPGTNNIESILNVKKMIFFLKKIAEQQHIVYNYFTKANNLITTEYLVYFQDIYAQSTRLNQAILIRSQMVISLLDVYISSINLQLSEIMKYLTIIATILMPVLIVSGYYGMNVLFPEYLLIGKEGTWFLAMILMFCSTSISFIYFKKKKWL